MALKDISRPKIIKKKFIPKLEGTNNVSLLGMQSGLGGGHSTMPPHGAGVSDGGKTKPGPAGGSFVSIDGEFSKVKSPISVIGDSASGGKGVPGSGQASGGSSPPSGGGGAG